MCKITFWNSLKKTLTQTPLDNSIFYYTIDSKGNLCSPTQGVLVVAWLKNDIS